MLCQQSFWHSIVGMFCWIFETLQTCKSIHQKNSLSTPNGLFVFPSFSSDRDCTWNVTFKVCVLATVPSAATEKVTWWWNKWKEGNGRVLAFREQGGRRGKGIRQGSDRMLQLSWVFSKTQQITWTGNFIISRQTSLHREENCMGRDCFT